MKKMFICAYKELQIEQQEAVEKKNNKCFSSGSDYSLFFGCIYTACACGIVKLFCCRPKVQSKNKITNWENSNNIFSLRQL